MLAAPMALSGLRLRKWLPPSRRIAGASSWEATDWAKIVGLYDMLLPVWPSPIVAPNHRKIPGSKTACRNRFTNPKLRLVW